MGGLFMKLITTQQIIKFNALLRNLGLEDDDKRGIIASFTNGRSERTNDMHFNEAHSMIEHLSKIAGEVPTPEVAHARRLQQEDKMRKKVISIAYKLGWTKPNGKCDYDKLNNFIATHPVSERKGISNINDYNYKELVKLINQFESLLNKHLNQFKK